MVRISKQKDGDDTGEWGFDLQVVPIGTDDDGDVVDSCVVIEAALPAIGSTRKKPLGKWEKIVVEVVGEMALAQTSGIEIDEVVKEVAERSGPAESGKRDTRKQHARRALMLLCEGDEAPFWVEDGCLSVM